MQAIKDLLKSERGLFALILVAAATTLCAVDKMTIDAWREMSLYIFGIYVGGKTISGTAALFAYSDEDAGVAAASTSSTSAPAATAPAATAPAATAPAAPTDEAAESETKSDAPAA